MPCRDGLRSSLSASVLTDNLLLSQLLVAGRKHGPLLRMAVRVLRQRPLVRAQLASIRHPQAPPKVSGWPETQRAALALPTLGVCLHLLSCKELLMILRDLSSQPTGIGAFPGGCALWDPAQEGERAREGPGPPGGLESEGLCPKPQWPHL